MNSQALARSVELAPVIERVHGERHPELTRVRQITEQLAASAPGTDVGPLFAELRVVTGDYAIPDDVCETFVAVYESLARAEDELGVHA
ncbi:hypothetical protein GCM10025789_13120 [Tessaracoccus lubricantis]|uniref:Iron-sulfur cluster repair di-iron protein, ric n=1 Tax=Tessaracoccus lubricantis TaxID=545543 RepID=A0ABP9FC51_9ACTN